jgi:hypothetical protein
MSTVALSTGCSSADDVDEVTSSGDPIVDTSGSGTEDPGRSELNEVSAFDTDFMQNIGTLQLGIDLAIEESVQACMIEEGFDYVPMTIDEIAQNLGMNYGQQTEEGAGASTDQFNSAKLALIRLDSADNPARVSPNDEILERLTGPEMEAWHQTYGDCLVAASEEHRNPLASEGNWFSEARDEASQRTAASEEVLEANDDFERCIADYGYDEIGEAAAQLIFSVEAVVSDLDAGAIGLQDARQSLEEIADREAELSADFETCDGPRREVEARVYTAEFAEIAERDEDKAALWAAEFKDEIESYLLDTSK